MTAREIWTKWRREIVRGTFLFAAVLAVGLLIISGVHRASSRVRDLAFDLGNDNSGSRTEAPPWNYVTKLGRHQTLWIRNVRGDVTVTHGAGDSVRVKAVRSFRHSDPESVRLITGSGPDGAAVCAVWGTMAGTCTPGHSISVKSSGMGSNDVRVTFEITLPPGVSADLETISGDVKADVDGTVRAGTIQGDVSVTSTSDQVEARTVTGDVSLELPRVLDPKSVQAKTVTGDVSVVLARGVRAVVTGHTVTGDISNEFSLPVNGKFASHDMSGTLGKGGGPVQLETVTGDISLNQVSGAVEAPEAPSAPTPPAAQSHRAPRAKTATPPSGTP